MRRVGIVGVCMCVCMELVGWGREIGLGLMV